MSLLLWECLGCFEDLVGASLPFRSVVNMIINFILEIERILLGRTWLGLKKNLQTSQELQKPPCIGQVPGEEWWKWSRA